MLQRTALAWPPDYREEMIWRLRQVEILRLRPDYAQELRKFYREPGGCLAFIRDWGVTYDPRNALTEGALTSMPFVLFPRQEELVDFIFACLRGEASGLVEKSRDMGATWVAVWVSIYLFLFWDGAAIGWGSRKSEMVDKIGVMDSILEKIRWSLRQLPRALKPRGFGDHHMLYMKIVNPQTGATIVGEGGDDIGRGGRTLIYFKDESAWYERPELIEASLGDNTRVQIDISSVSGLGTVFHRKRESAAEWRRGADVDPTTTNLFVLDWRDHPAKTEEWYRTRKAKALNDGLLHVFAQEVDRNYAATVQGTIIDYEWVLSAIDADEKLGIRMDDGGWAAALDVADSDSADGDRNALAKRRGVKLKYLDEWADRDTGVTTRRAIAGCEDTLPIDLWYDCIGVGAGVKSEANRLADDDLVPDGLRLRPWDAGAGPLNADKRVVDGDEDSPLVGDFYGNLKAQGWWELRTRFYKTHRAVTEGIRYPVDELICIPSTLPRIRQLEKELCQPTQGKSARLKLIVNKTPKGMRSPNLGDGVMMCYWPAEERGTYDASLSWVDGGR